MRVSDVRARLRHVEVVGEAHSVAVHAHLPLAHRAGSSRPASAWSGNGFLKVRTVWSSTCPTRSTILKLVLCSFFTREEALRVTVMLWSRENCSELELESDTLVPAVAVMLTGP